ncbi:cable pili-associated 22 kda adhesin protein [Pseudomonas fluorescens]|uniref:Cable pili-associated 22 kDa adhesin protein n=1 Tax=Pseudomonas fluorescens TaxID=294 RepID=A0A448E0Q3_PSEFL|nr:Ig-like domain-containing protein [Pseudomonas fluorescens]VEF12562.1 cable pili-associated 22 kda adhesin protein [Pseudomonas fluorescens]
MREPTIQADQNLLLNGDFSKGIKPWKKGPVNPRWTAVMHDTYLGASINFLRAGNGSSVHQVLVVPKPITADVRYKLSFLYATNHVLPAKVLLSVEETGQQQEIELPGELASVIETRRLLRAAGQPLAVDFDDLEVELKLELAAGQNLCVEVCSPPNEVDDESSDIYITCIKLHLHLPSLQLQGLELDGQLLLPGALLYVCLGADSGSISEGHRLQFSPQGDSDWLGTNAALTIKGNPQGAILASPEWGTEQPLTAEWQLSCPLIGDVEPYLFTLELVNQYTAQPYSLRGSLGHHRVAISDAVEAAYYPVYGQSVRLGVQVTSHYTAQTLSGRTVNWTDEQGRVRAAVNTGDDGWAYFDYLPDSPGDLTILASVESLYYQSGTVTRAFAVKVLATDPWDEVTDAEGAPWQEKTGYPNRGTSYSLQVKVPTVLQGTSMSLGWSGDLPEQLGVTVSPSLGEPILVGAADPLWTLTSEDRLDGVFHLQLSCSKLKLRSACKTMSLACNVVKIGEVREANKFPIVDEQESVLLRVQALHDVTGGDGDPVINAQVQWLLPEGETHSIVTGAGGWASVLYTPKSAGLKKVVAEVRAHSEAPPVEHVFDVTPLAGSPWADQVLILLDDVVVDRAVLGLLCWRGESHTLKVEAVPESEFIGRDISLDWRGDEPGIGLNVTGLGTARPLPKVGGLTWVLNSDASESVSSLFELKLSSPPLADRELFGRLIANDLSDEMSVVLDQTVAIAGDVLHPCLGALHRYSVRPNELSPLVGLEVLLSLATGQLPPEATVEPALAVPQTLTDGGAHWSFDFSNSVAAETFDLNIEIEALKKPALISLMKLDHNRFKIELPESPVDPVVGQAPAWLWARVISHYTDVPVANVPVQWNAAQSSDTDGDGWSRFAVEPQTAGLQTVRASVVSPYDGYEQHLSTSILALASDPWKDVKVSFDGDKRYSWGEKTAFPRRGGQHRVELCVPDGSPLIGRQLTLGMTGMGPAELGLVFQPEKALGTPVVFSPEGLAFPFAVGDQSDGSFSLRLAAERLVSLSPANAMSVGSASVVLKFANETRARKVLDWNQELVEQVTLVSSISGRPMVGIEVTWSHADIGTQTSVTDFYGVARLRFIPRTPGDSVLTATVGDEGFSKSVGLEFTVNEPRKVDVLYESLDSRRTAEQSRAHAHARVVSALTGEPLAGVEVFWDYDQHELGSSWTNALGIADLIFTFVAEQADVLTATVRGGLAGWHSESLVISLRDDYWDLADIQAEREPTYVGQQVRILATVKSRDTGVPIAGANVHWMWGAGRQEITSTGGDGKASLLLLSSVAGEEVVSATVVNLDESSRDLTLTVLPVTAHPEYARIESFRAYPNPAAPYSKVKFFGRLISNPTGLPLPERQLEVRYGSTSGFHLKSDAAGTFEFDYMVGARDQVVISVVVDNPIGGHSFADIRLTID